MNDNTKTAVLDRAPVIAAQQAGLDAHAEHAAFVTWYDQHHPELARHFTAWIGWAARAALAVTQPAASDELRRDVLAMAELLSNHEWADHVCKDPDAELLAAQISASIARPVASGELPKLPRGSMLSGKNLDSLQVLYTADQMRAYGQQCADSRPAGGATDRDAALEEAAALCDGICGCCWESAQDAAESLAEEIRSLKSQPAAPTSGEG